MQTNNKDGSMLKNVGKQISTDVTKDQRGSNLESDSQK